MYINIVSQLQQIPDIIHVPVFTKKAMLKYSHYNELESYIQFLLGELKNFLYTNYKEIICSNYKGNAQIPLICL